MSALAEFSGTSAAEVTWYSPVEDLWVASTPFDFLGMVESTDEGFAATDGDGRDLGFFPSADAARAAVVAAYATA